MAFVYLIGQSDTKDVYKIGMTTKKKIDHRLKELQTGNSEELFLKDYYETETPYRLETMLHHHFKPKLYLNEWYSIKEEDRKNFKNICDKYQEVIDSLKDNPFFKNC